MSTAKGRLTGPKEELLQQLVANANADELYWIQGYIAALLDRTAPEQAIAKAQPGKITLVYGTETGNSKKVATDLAARARKDNFSVKLVSLDQYRLTDLTKEEHLFVVISTQGDGEPPVAAQKFYEHIHLNGFRLDQLRYGVLALGDSSYPLFCKTGEDVDLQLEKLGAKRAIPLRKCDVDFEADAGKWYDELVKAVRARSAAVPVAPAAVIGTVAQKKKALYEGTVLSHTELTDHGSGKKIWHIEVQTEGVAYEAGDAIGIVPENDKDVVQRIITYSGLAEDSLFTYKEEQCTFYDLLLKKLSLQNLSEKFTEKFAVISGVDIPKQKSGLLSLLQQYPVQGEAKWQELIQALPAIAPRIYTIASAPAMHGEEIHLTVEKHHFDNHGTVQAGLCTGWMEDWKTGDQISFFIQKNKRFRLPASAAAPMIMIGPGTGIAPFRSFLGERTGLGANGFNWLFFAGEKYTTDFLYQTDLQDMYHTGTLHKISVAFEKEFAGEKTITDLIRKEGKALAAMLQSGAYLYLSGEKDPMSREVEKLLLEIIAEHITGAEEAAVALLEQWKNEGRYCKDVY
jgi:sulfite reductase (NADPH) flavoprotein alpha-component